MLKILLLTLLFFGHHLNATEINSFTSIDVYRIIQLEHKEESLRDYTKKEELVSACVSKYIRQQSKSYTKSTLYDLIKDFDSVNSKIHGRFKEADNIPYNKKIETLAQVQCELYFNLNMLK